MPRLIAFFFTSHTEPRPACFRQPPRASPIRRSPQTPATPCFPPKNERRLAVPPSGLPAHTPPPFQPRSRSATRSFLPHYTKCARSLCCRAGSRSSSPASLSPCSPCAVFIAPLRALRLRLTLAANFITSHRFHTFGQESFLTGIPTASGLRSVLSGGLAICRILNPRE